jgi:hypothetical protein
VAGEQDGPVSAGGDLAPVSWKTVSMSGSSPDVGSSRISSSASDASADTSATFWRLPLE